MKRILFNNLHKTDKNILKNIQSSVFTQIKQCDFINGKQLKLFEKHFADYIGTKYCIGVSSGTSALEIGIKSLQIDSGNIDGLPS